jgi:hypothetical protein
MVSAAIQRVLGRQHDRVAIGSLTDLKRAYEDELAAIAAEAEHVMAVSRKTHFSLVLLRRLPPTRPPQAPGRGAVTIVRTAYRYKRPPRRKKPVALEVPAVVKAADPAKAHRNHAPASTESAPAVVNATIKRTGASAAPAANDDHKPVIPPTIRKANPGGGGGPHRQMELPLSRQQGEREEDAYKRLKAAMARRLRGE